MLPPQDYNYNFVPYQPAPMPPPHLPPSNAYQPPFMPPHYPIQNHFYEPEMYPMHPYEMPPMEPPFMEFPRRMAPRLYRKAFRRFPNKHLNQQQ